MMTNRVKVLFLKMLFLRTLRWCQHGSTNCMARARWTRVHYDVRRMEHRFAHDDRPLAGRLRANEMVPPAQADKR